MQDSVIFATNDACDQLAGLRSHVEALATTIGPRNVYHYDALQEAAGYLTRSFERLGYRPELQEFMARGRRFANIFVEMPGNTLPGEILVVGAHYDTHKHSPGANDNASAVAALLELAGHFAKRQLARTVRFLAFTNEETPFTRTRHMGSRMYARACRAKHENIVGMLCLETIGYCSDEQGSQWLSFGGLLLPRRGNFLALVGIRDRGRCSTGRLP